MDASNIKVKELRRFLGLTMAEFAEILGYDQSYISQIENGKKDVTAKLIARLKAEFHIKAGKILED